MTKEEIYNLLLTPKANGGLNQIQESGFKKLFPNEYEELQKIEFPEEFIFRQKLYHYLKCDNLLELGVCYCGKRCNFINLKKGYHKYCCNQHAQMSQDSIEKKKETCFKKYGSETYNNREKSRETCLKIYGVSNPQQLKETQEKTKKTKIIKYGDCKEIYGKAKKTKKEKYGDENYNNFQKAKETCLQKYNVDNVFKLEETKQKAKQTNLKKLGVEYSSQSDLVKEKVKKTNNERYGVDYATQSDLVKEKVKKTNNERYGKDYYQQTNEAKKRIGETNLKKYGNACSLHGKEIEQKTRETNLNKYGTIYPTQNKDIKKKTKETNMLLYGVEYSSQNKETREKTKNTCLEKFGVEWACMRKEAKEGYTNDSKPNKKFAGILDSFGIEYEREFPIGCYSYDFKIGNTVVEINPTITHNSFLNIFGGNPKDINYHYNKTKCANENGYRCIQVWDWDDMEKVVPVLIPKEKTIYARNCETKNVSLEDALLFLNENHIQGSCKGQKILMGLFFENELVGIMTFGKPRYNMKYEWELLRLCYKKGVVIVGGTHKLFSCFLKMHNPKSIVSYCDLSKFDGNVYKKLGFCCIRKHSFGLHWWNGKTHITDNLLRQKGFDNLFGTNYGKNFSNYNLMIEHKFLPVYDCGQATFVWEP